MDDGELRTTSRAHIALPHIVNFRFPHSGRRAAGKENQRRQCTPGRENRKARGESGPEPIDDSQWTIDFVNWLSAGADPEPQYDCRRSGCARARRMQDLVQNCRSESSHCAQRSPAVHDRNRSARGLLGLICVRLLSIDDSQWTIDYCQLVECWS